MTSEQENIMYEDEDDWDEEEQWLYECGAMGQHLDGLSDIECWQKCSMAGTEFCDFECPFAADVRQLLRRP